MNEALSHRIGSLDEGLAYIQSYLKDPQQVSEPIVPQPLNQLCQIFGLSSFQRDLMLMCLASQLDPQMGSLCASAANDENRPFVTFQLALALLPNAHWDALLPDGRLRRFLLLDVASNVQLVQAQLSLPERMLHFLVGSPTMDERLIDIVEPVHASETPSTRQLREADELAAMLGPVPKPRPHFHITGASPSERRKVAALACHSLERSLFSIAGSRLPTKSTDLCQMLRYWQREALLGGHVLYVESEDQLDLNSADDRRILESLGAFEGGPLIMGSRDRFQFDNGASVHYQLQRSSYPEQRQFWQTALVNRSLDLSGTVDRLVSQFVLPENDIQAACTTLAAEDPEQAVLDKLWAYCRNQLQPAMDVLAHRIEPVAQLNDLVLPDTQRKLLEEIASQARHRVRVFEDWQFRGKSGRDQGISVLFHGSSGTGKTMAAEVLAGLIGLNLYRIDLSTVVSKYIGETEKNLSRIFDAAENGGSILLFDEADAIFGKRSEVKSSHDRHANIEVAYLLQRIEAFRGLAILTTNLKQDLDVAFLRRIRFFVRFPFPNQVERERIWMRIFPEQTPLAELDYARLGRMNLAGGNIRNIAVNAAFRAADEGNPVNMSHVRHAAEREYEKLDRILTELDD